VLIAGFPAGTFGTNCYVVANAPGEPCLIVDPGQDSIDGVLEIVSENRLAPAAVLLTHGHIDHIWCVAPVSDRFGIPAYIHADDRYRLEDPAGNTMFASREKLLSMTKGALELTEPDDVCLFDTSTPLDIAGIQLSVRHAPGHTEGSVVFERAASGDVPPIMWSGDVLFAGSIGRTDLPGGDSDAMRSSLRSVIWPAPDDMVVLPGHGEQTTIAAERASNPYLREFNGGSATAMPTRGM
jgi:glyoxylase-like metal-dependent hydrolase (beta-lactamase superfamily II)